MGCVSSQPAQTGASAKSSAVKPNGWAKAGSNEKEDANQLNKTYQETMFFLSQVPLFMRLPKDQHPILAAACVTARFKAGETIITQGEIGSEFFIIQSGEAEVMIGETKVANLKSADYFGENALLRNEPRSATIRAVTAISTLRITQEKFKELGLNEKVQFANRKAVGAGGKRQLE
ncbi:unnamed protein product, partial [Polarella glacialis]